VGLRAVVAQGKANREQQSARSLGKASIVLSVIGIVVGVIAIIISVIVAVTGTVTTTADAFEV